MTVFYGGQIRQEARGNLAVVLEVDRKTQMISPFLYPQDSEEFVHLTGVRAANNPPVRVYMGINQKAGDEIVRAVADKRFGAVDFTSLDRDVVLSFFLREKSLDDSRVTDAGIVA